MNLFDFGSILRTLLTEDETVASYLGTKVFPLVAPEKTTFPFLVYQRSSGYGEYNKDYLTSYTVNIDILIFSNKYIDVVNITEAVDNFIKNPIDASYVSESIIIAVTSYQGKHQLIICPRFDFTK